MARCWVFLVWVWVLVRGSLCLFWRETYTKGLHARFSTRLDEDEGRQGPKEKRERGSQEKEEEQRSGLNRPVSRRKRSTAGTCEHRGLVSQRERMSQRPWWFCGNFARIHARDSSQNARKVSQTSPFLRKELTRVCVCLFSFLPPSRLCVLCFECP